MTVLHGAVKRYTLFILTMFNSLYDSLETQTDICKCTISITNNQDNLPFYKQTDH